MTTTSPVVFSPALHAFIEALATDENLRNIFDNLFAAAGGDAGKAAIIAKTAEAGTPISAEDIDALQRAAAEQIGEKALNDEALDAVGGGAPNPVAQLCIRLIREGKIWGGGSRISNP
jgi:hypothetical protein